MSDYLLSQLRSNRADAKMRLDRILEAPTRQQRNLTPAESREFDAVADEIRQMDERIEDLKGQQDRDRTAGATTRRYGLGGNQRSYGAGNGNQRTYDRESPYHPGPDSPSFFRDLYRGPRGDRDAVDRLDRNNRIVDMEKRAISTTNGAGGEFVPPLWLEDRYIQLARPGRVSADLCTQGMLPAGTDVINIPKINTGTAVAVQGTQNTGIQQTDLTTTSVASPVITIAGGQTVSLQLIEQSPLNMDEVILRDLAADYARYLNLQVLSGTGSGGQATGLLVLGGTQAVTWTQATPALGGAGGLYAKIANAIQLIQTARFMPPTAIVMHPRRWAWCISQSDANNRPLVVPESSGPWNAAALLGDDAPAQQYVGRMVGLPVFTDSLLPTNIGAGTNQDEVYIAKTDDLYLWEGQIRAEAFQQTFANNMSVFVRLYNYVSFQPGRYAPSIATINGTGLVPPAF